MKDQAGNSGEKLFLERYSCPSAKSLNAVLYLFLLLLCQNNFLMGSGLNSYEKESIFFNLENNDTYPLDISGIWENTTIVPAYEYEGHVKRESSYKLTLNQIDDDIDGTFLTRIHMNSGVVQKHIRIKGTYKNGKIHLKTVGLIEEDCYTPGDVSALFDLEFTGEAKMQGQELVLEAEYDFASQKTFSTIGNMLVRGYGGSNLKGPVKINVRRTVSFEKNKQVAEPVVVRNSPVASSRDSIFSHILFKQSTSELLSTQDSLELIRLGNVLATYPDWKVVLSGYTENRGEWEKNLILSRERSAVIKDKLVKMKHISPDRIVVEGYGPLYPVADNRVVENRQLNRRVEIKIVPDFAENFH